MKRRNPKTENRTTKAVRRVAEAFKAGVILHWRGRTADGRRDDQGTAGYYRSGGKASHSTGTAAFAILGTPGRGGRDATFDTAFGAADHLVEWIGVGNAIDALKAAAKKAGTEYVNLDTPIRWSGGAGTVAQRNPRTLAGWRGDYARANPSIKIPRATLAERIAHGKAELLADVKAGRVPATARDFSELHDYVDANGNGGWFIEGGTEGKKWGYRSYADVKMANAVGEAIDAWIKAGGLRGSVKSNPSPFRAGARVQDEYGNVGTVEAVPRSRGGAYHVRMDPTGPTGVRSFANVALLLRSELRGAGPKARRNPQESFDPTHYRSERDARDARDARAKALRAGGIKVGKWALANQEVRAGGLTMKGGTAYRHTRDATVTVYGLDYARANPNPSRMADGPAVKAPGRKRNPSAIGQRVTVYFSGPMGAIGSKEGTLSAVDAHGVDFIPKGGRRAHRIMAYYSPFIMVVNGWGKAKPGSGMVPVASSTPGVTVSRGLYRSHDPRWVSDFMRDVGNKYAPIALFDHGQLVSGGG
jgi:hypothetical protein